MRLFQSYQGSILTEKEKGKYPIEYISILSRFNFNLKHLQHTQTAQAFQSYQGSILTRHTLKQRIRLKQISILSRFNFNSVAVSQPLQNITFQSYQGSILTLAPHNRSNREHYFNPIKVQF